MPADGIFRNVCPRNCYGTCSLLSYVQKGKLVKVAGDSATSFTNGRLCAKGYAYPDYVYSEQRLRYPLRQSPRGSGRWTRVNWEEALDEITDKLLELYERYGSHLSSAYNHYSGNLGLLHTAVPAFFNSLGKHSFAAGDACLAAGSDALAYNEGSKQSRPDPESMADSKCLILWGVNPAWTAVHQMSFINAARDRGAPLVVIDPIFTSTAARADLYVQICPGTDGLLALALIKILDRRGVIKEQTVSDHVGGESFMEYVREKIDLAEAAAVTGVTEEAMRKLASMYERRPGATWCGFGLQRQSNGGQNMRAIGALVSLSGNDAGWGGGLFYNHTNIHVAKSLFECPTIRRRPININNFAPAALALNEPPLKFLLISCRNPLTQDQHLKKWRKLLAQLELVVTIDLFMTETAQASHLVLPAASFFEEYDLHTSYWHHWLALNQKAIPSFYEAKSDLEIMRLLCVALNRKKPGLSSFPSERTAQAWIEAALTPETAVAYGLNSAGGRAAWEELLTGPRKLRTECNIPAFSTPSGHFELFSSKAVARGLPALPSFLTTKVDEADYPLRLITPQAPLAIHSQFQAITRLQAESPTRAAVLEMNADDARARGIADNDDVVIYSRTSRCRRIALINPTLPAGLVVVYQGNADPINILMSGLFTDMGSQNCIYPGPAYYDTRIDVVRWSDALYPK